MAKPLTRKELLAQIDNLEQRIAQLEAGPTPAPGDFQLGSALGDDQTLLRILLDNLPQDIFVKDLQGRFQLCNRQTIENLQTGSAQNLIGKTDFDFMPAPIAEIYQEEEREIIRSGTPQINRMHRFLALGKSGWYQGTKLPVRNSQGEIIGLLGVNHDITQLKQAQDELAKEHRLLQVLMNTVPDHLFVKDRQSRFILANSGSARQLGARSPEEMVGKTDYDYLEPELAREFYEEEQRIMATGAPLVNRLIYDGKAIWMLSTKLPLRDSEGKIIGIVGLNHDITEIRHAQQALHQSEERFRLVSEVTSDYAFLLRLLDDQLHYVREWRMGSIERILGFTEAELDARGGWFAELHPDDNAWMRQWIKALISENRPDAAEFRMFDKDNKLRWMWAYLRPLRDPENPEIIRLIGAGQDITARKNAELATRRSEEYFRGIFEESPIGVVLFDAGGDLLQVNNAALEIFGFQAPAQNPSYNLFRTPYLTPEQRQRIQRGETVRTEISLNLNELGKHLRVAIPRPGRIFLDLILTPLGQSRQERTGYLIKIQDITARKEMEALLRHERDFSQSIIQTAQVIVLVLDLEGKIINFNPYAEEICGYSLAEVKNRRWLDLFIPAEQRDELEAAFIQTLKDDTGRNPVTRRINPILTRAGHLRQIEWQNKILKDAAGRLIGLLAIGQDVTEQQQAQRKLIDYQDQLRGLARELTLAEERERRRIAGELHDHINQVLAFSLLRLQQVASAPSEPEAAQTLAETMELLQQTIQDTRMLTFDLSSPILYHSGLEAAIEEWLREQVQKQHRLECRFADDAQPKPLAEDVQVLLFRAVREILNNIIKHAQARAVQVKLSRDNGRIRIEIIIDGVGFNSDLAELGRQQKSGFGLFSIQERLDNLGGTVMIDSGPSRGAKVVLTAPLLTPRRDENGSQDHVGG